MAGAMRKMAVYLGLVEDDGYDGPGFDPDDEFEPEPEPQSPPSDIPQPLHESHEAEPASWSQPIERDWEYERDRHDEPSRGRERSRERESRRLSNAKSRSGLNLSSPAICRTTAHLFSRKCVSLHVTALSTGSADLR